MDFNEDENTLIARHPRRSTVVHETPWFGRTGTVSNPAQLPVGSITPAGLISPNDYDSWDFNTTTDLSAVPDVTANIQAAINTIQATGYGGVVQLPPGILRCNGITISGGGVVLRGASWEEYAGVGGASSPAVRGKRGTYLLRNGITNNTPCITVANSANNVTIEEIAFLEIQPPESPTFQPVGGNPSIIIQGPNSGSVMCRRLLFWGTAGTGILIGSAGNAAGRVTCRDISYAGFGAAAISTIFCNSLIVDGLIVSSDLLAGSPNQQAYMKGHTRGLALTATSQLSLAHLVMKNILLDGILFSSSSDGACKNSKIVDAVFLGVTAAIHDAATNSRLSLSGISYDGTGVNSGSAAFTGAIVCEGAGATIDIDDLVAQNCWGSGVYIGNLAQGTDLRISPTCWVDNWNLAGAGSAALTCTFNGTSNNALRYSSGNTRFTNSNGGANTGGGGSITAY